MKRYEALAADLGQAIANGVLKPGDRLPSVRQASRDRRVSPATVFEAYALLEARGLAAARPRSGWYVAAAAMPRPPVPEQVSAPDGEARPVAISELVFAILASTMSREVVPLGSAFPDPRLFPLPRLARALAAGNVDPDPWATVEELTPGHLPLRRQIAIRYLADGVRMDPDAIVVTNGAMEALNLCVGAVCRPGDTVVVESPCFYACLQILERHGLHALEVATDPREGIDLAALEAAIVRHRPRAAWVMTNFQNPLGSTMDAAKKRALVALATKYRLPLIEDDVYAELHDGARPPSSKAFDADGWVLHCSSFSKTLAPGYRLGWCAPGRFLREVAQQKLAASLATCVPAQRGLARYLQRGGFERHLRLLRRTLGEYREQYGELVMRAFPDGTRISRPDGGYFLWLELPEGNDALALQRAAMQQGISVAPGPMFSAAQGFRRHLRLNCGQAPDARLRQAIATLGRLARPQAAAAL